jgi:hypothetical protein
MKKLTLLLVLPTLLLPAAACGGGDDDDDDAKAASSVTTDGPPENLTEAEMACPLDAFSIEAITGLKVGAAENIIETGDGISCTFGTPEGDTGFSFITYKSTGASAMDTIRQVVDDAEAVEIDWADAALWSPGQTVLQVQVGDAGAQVQITDLAGVVADPLQTATELAEIAAG